MAHDLLLSGAHQLSTYIQYSGGIQVPILESDDQSYPRHKKGDCCKNNSFSEIWKDNLFITCYYQSCVGRDFKALAEMTPLGIPHYYRGGIIIDIVVRGKVELRYTYKTLITNFSTCLYICIRM